MRVCWEEIKKKARDRTKRGYRTMAGRNFFLLGNGGGFKQARFMHGNN